MFKLKSKYKPCGDQIQAIEQLTQGVIDGYRDQVLLGVTGSGKTFTMANIIQNTQRPTLVIAHNKTLAAQLCNEFREFFPENRVEYFVSYYDYYQPEAYIPTSDTYIEKDLQINDEIDRLRNSATSALCEGRDVIIVASVSCIYGLGAPIEYYSMSLSLRESQEIGRDALIDKLVQMQYQRNDIDFKRATFKVNGDIVEIYPVQYKDKGIRIDFFGDEIESIKEFDVVTGKPLLSLKHTTIFPASHFVVEQQKRDDALENIRKDLSIRKEFFDSQNKLIESQRILERTSQDIEMIKELGTCKGIENYSRYFDGREEGQAPYTLLDFFPDDFLIFIDESHITLPQIHAMYRGDLSRKTNLVEYGFRLPAAYDNRPLKFEEFDNKIKQIIYVSATPAKYELEKAAQIAEQVIRPTGLLDPKIEVHKIDGQIDDLISNINIQLEKNGRVLITTLTKKMAESLTEFLKEQHFKVRYMHSDVDTLERMDIVTGLRRGDFDILVGINLLREGLDMPEVTLVAILDADKEGFLRSETSLIQTIGRAARNSEAKVIMYADVYTDSMKKAIEETNRRRKIQEEYNKKNNIIPKTIIKDIVNSLEISKGIKDNDKALSKKDILNEIERVKKSMALAAANLDFEMAIHYREEISKLKEMLKDYDKRNKN